MKKQLTFYLIFFITLPIFSESFKFSYSINEKYKIISSVKEDVYINGIFSHSADILNKISVHVKDVKKDGGFLEATYITSEKTLNEDGIYEFSTEYKSEFYRDSRGKYEISSKYFMPVVRGVPFFPDKNIEPGDSWTAKAEEAHDFRA